MAHCCPRTFGVFSPGRSCTQAAGWAVAAGHMGQLHRQRPAAGRELAADTALGLHSLWGHHRMEPAYKTPFDKIHRTAM